MNAFNFFVMLLCSGKFFVQELKAFDKQLGHRGCVISFPQDMQSL